MKLSQRCERLISWIKAVSNDVSDIVLDRHVFDTVGNIIQRNAAVREERSHFFQWMITAYVESAAVAVRRQVRSNEAISLSRVLEELQKFSEVASFEYHDSLYGPKEKRWARDTFEQFADDTGTNQNVQQVAGDAAQLEQVALPITHYVDRRVAHYDPRGTTMKVPTFGDLNSAINTLERLTAKYYLLMTATSTTLLPVIQYNWVHVFTMPWMPRSVRSA